MSDATNLNYLYTIGGYATLFGVGYAIYHVSTQKNRKRAALQPKSAKPSQQSESRKDDRKKKQRMESFTSETQGSSEKAEKPEKADRPEKAPKAKAPAKAAEPNPFLSNVQDNDASDDVDNREFAKQLAKAKQGKQFATSNSDSGKKQKEKSIKQSRANQIGAPAEEKPVASSAPSSGDGAEADDDESPARSPVAEPTDASGVADMLEPAAAGPSVLRLTDTEPKDKKKKKGAKAAEPVETKKQRQNRKKAEAARAAREDAEKERRTLEEKQRRAARIAEGRPAKDGSTFTAANGTKSAWTQGAPNGGHAQTTEPNGVSSHQLLDTFEAPAAAAEPAKPSGSSKTDSVWVSSLPSEEEQLEMLKNEADEWSTVKTKASKRSAKKETSGSGDDAPAQARSAPQPKQPAPAASTNNTAKAPQNFGSFSALTAKDEPAEEVEEEWDV